MGHTGPEDQDRQVPQAHGVQAPHRSSQRLSEIEIEAIGGKSSTAAKPKAEEEKGRGAEAGEGDYDDEEAGSQEGSGEEKLDMAHKKIGLLAQRRDSHAQRLGVKMFDGQQVTAGMILVRQRGTRFRRDRAPASVATTIFAKQDGKVAFQASGARRLVAVVPTPRSSPVFKTGPTSKCRPGVGATAG